MTNVPINIRYRLSSCSNPEGSLCNELNATTLKYSTISRASDLSMKIVHDIYQSPPESLKIQLTFPSGTIMIILVVDS